MRVGLIIAAGIAVEAVRVALQSIGQQIYQHVTELVTTSATVGGLVLAPHMFFLWIAHQRLPPSPPLFFVSHHGQLDSDDEAYRWLLTWLADHPAFKTSHSYQITSTLHRYRAAQRYASRHERL